MIITAIIMMMIIIIITTTITTTIIIIISKRASLYLSSLKYDFKAIWVCLKVVLEKLIRFVTPLD